MVNKKGISDVVTTVLIILLALAAVVIIWAFVRPTIQDTSQNINVASDCLKTEIKPVSCSNTNGVVVQLVSRGASEIKTVKAIVTAPDGSTTVVNAGVPANDLETVTILASAFDLDGDRDPDISAGEIATASVVLKGPDGSEHTCAESAVRVTCE
jgi:hypothetical protein